VTIRRAAERCRSGGVELQVAQRATPQGVYVPAERSGYPLSFPGEDKGEGKIEEIMSPLKKVRNV